MHFSNLLPLLSLASLGTSLPSNNGQLESGSITPFMFSSSASSVYSNPTPTPSAKPLNGLGRAVVINQCRDPVYIWSVGSTVRPEVTVLPDGEYTETFRTDPVAGGIAIKISTEQDGLYVSAPTTVFAYNLSGHQVWYDLSDVFGDPFAGYPVRMQPADPEIYWEQGISPAGSQVRQMDASTDLVLTLC
ncbi:uncharacterized protein PFLUO_LOCUS4710 [Penicillium psychrofluorescens]|uniref:uncharacterized protein n=1 Tax=Penicillium psychrofluorescens TaxID=3158075 RepID=UPI003CCCCB88